MSGESPADLAEIEAIRRLPYGLRGFRRFCRLLVLEDGSKFQLSAWEVFVLGFYFSRILELVIILPKKNGKTTLLAALALYHLLMTEAAECVIGASSLEQAGIMHRQACSLVERSGLQRQPIERTNHRERTQYEGVFDIKPGMREIRYGRGRIRTLAADANTADGIIPTLALVDELHRHPSGDLYGVFRDGLGPRDGQIITISTPGLSMDSPLGMLRRQAIKLPKQTKGKRRTYRSKDFALIEWGLEPGDDPENLRLVKMANPAPHQTIPKLRQRRDSPSRLPGQWERFGAGMWTTLGEKVLVAEDVWDGLRADIGGLTDGDQVYVAVRAFQTEGCGIGIAGLRGEKVAVAIEVLEYGLPDLTSALRALAVRYDVRMVYVDRRQQGLGSDVLSAAGLPLEDLPQTPVRFMEATGTFLGLVSSGKLIHNGDEVLREQVLAGRAKETTTGLYLEPSPETRAFVALNMAVHEAIKHANDRPPRIHAYRGA